MSEKAIEIVKRCLEGKSPYLDIGRCSLRDQHLVIGSELDNLLMQCTHITTLILSNVWYTWVGDKYFQRISSNTGGNNVLKNPPHALIALKGLKCLICCGDSQSPWSISDIGFLEQFEQLEVLDLSFNNIAEIKGLNNLTQLQEFYISHNQLRDLKNLDKLTQLRFLDINNNQIHEIGGLDNLVQLRLLNIGNNKIQDINNLDHLMRLRFFIICNNYIQELKGINNLCQLQYLVVSQNQIREIKGIDKLDKLLFLDISDNKIEKLQSLDNLVKLQKINISNNSIQSLEYLVDFSPFVIGQLDYMVGENPIISPPKGIYELGREAIINYYAQLQKEGEKQYLFEAKLLVIGEGGCGKTSFIRKLQEIHAVLPEEKDTTLGIEISQWKFITNFNKSARKDITFHVNLWDFGGQKIYHGTHQIFFYDKSLYVLVADTREQKTDFTYWLNTVEQIGGEKSILLIVLNEKHGHVIKFDEAYRQHFYDIIKEVFTLDLKNDILKVRELQEKVQDYLKQLEGIGDPLPSSWVNIRGELGRERKNFISFDRFREICGQFSITDKSMIHTLSSYYNRIGAITHYVDDPLLQHRVYLNSNWLVKTVYRVIDSELAKDKNKKGRLTETEIKHMWADNELNYELPQLTELMHKFGLMYHVPHSDLYVIPAHLPTGQPYTKWKYADEQNLLQFKYEFEKYMPQGILSHVIVLLHKYIKDHSNVWHKGVNIELDGAYAEITESIGSKNAFEIRIAGNRRRELLAIIRQQFAELFQPYKKLRYEQKVPCNCKACRDTTDKHFYNYSELIERKKNNKLTIECQRKPYMDVSIARLIDSVDVPIEMEGSHPKGAMKTGKKGFISYSHKDEKTWKIPLFKHLSSLVDAGLIEAWSDRQIESGEWDTQIKQAMEDADVFLLLVTANFISSKYITTKETTTAFRKYREGNAQIFPIICSACKWEIMPLGEDEEGKVSLGNFLACPRDAKPIKNWSDKEEGFLDVVNQLEKLLRRS